MTKTPHRVTDPGRHFGVRRPTALLSHVQIQGADHPRAAYALGGECHLTELNSSFIQLCL